MIPAMNIVAWGRTVPWAEQRQVEQDLVMARALVEIFSDEFLRTQLRFRGGTALNKLHFPKALRYSEDIDFTRTTEGKLGPVLDRLRAVLQPWMGHAHYDLGLIGPSLTFTMEAEDKASKAPIRVKIEMATRERTAYDGPHSVPFAVKNSWFTGTANIETFSKEEILATKLRALLQRDKGRDLVDLSHAHAVFDDLDHARVVTLFDNYLTAAEQAISRAEAEERMFAKLAEPSFLADVRPLLTAEEAIKFDAAAGHAAFRAVFQNFIKRIPGHPWKKTKETAEQFGMPELAED
jgi:predicted nucleotidyltransferase component of viral defense system